MNFYVKYDLQVICRNLLLEKIGMIGLDCQLNNTNELSFREEVSPDFLATINEGFRNAGIEIVASPESIIVEKTKEAILELISEEDNLVLSKTSHHLARTLNVSYRYLAAVFSEVTYSTIENYIILQKVERAKGMIAAGILTFTEVAWKLNYSSVGHFSMQFKNTTGLTPTLFKKIITQRRNNQQAAFSMNESPGLNI
ncbi:AraC family transcriptional regulator [Terrimonas sp. NA20]|uniref:AraC family transcriptional regulator n=1 Tax=Terrimonas ginsenosidimutans TaxID=2908004 RepID=A0ABS9KS42_9BACT|nr:AraC family transcriptional regulator [Terrimonas ginsenosidimutans]MCG2615147.1 AraC family transcriptional regulator [Terrimonas ginsenosidimutans]